MNNGETSVEETVIKEYSVSRRVVIVLFLWISTWLLSISNRFQPINSRLNLINELPDCFR